MPRRPRNGSHPDAHYAASATAIPVVRGRAYTTTVVALATFALLLILFPSHPNRFVVEARMHQTFDGPEKAVRAALEESIVDSITSERFLRDALTPELTSGNPPPEEEKVNYQKLAAQLQVAIVPDAAPATSRTIRIRLSGPDQNLTERVLADVVQSYAQANNRANKFAEKEARVQELNANLTFWTSRIASIRSELDSHVESELQRRKPEANDRVEEADPEQDVGTIPIENVVESEEKPIAEIRNPRHQALERQIADTEADLIRLRLTHTDAHPLVVESQRVLTSMRAALLELPATVQLAPTHNPFVVSEQKKDLPSIDRHDAPSGSDVVAAPFDEAAVRRAIESEPAATELRRSLRDAESRFAALTKKRQALSAQDNDHLGISTAVVQTPQLVEVVRRPVDSHRVLCLLLPGLVAGIACSLAGARSIAPEVLTSARDVEESLKTRIAGELPMPDGPAIPKWEGGQIPHWARRTLVASELTLVAVVVLVLICCAAVPGFAARSVGDPLGSLNTALEQMGIYR